MYIYIYEYIDTVNCLKLDPQIVLFFVAKIHGYPVDKWMNYDELT